MSIELSDRDVVNPHTIRLVIQNKPGLAAGISSTVAAMRLMLSEDKCTVTISGTVSSYTAEKQLIDELVARQCAFEREGTSAPIGHRSAA